MRTHPCQQPGAGGTAQIPLHYPLHSIWKGPNTSACAVPPQRPCECLLSFTSSRGGWTAALHFLQNFSCFSIYQEHLLGNLEGSGNGAISAREEGGSQLHRGQARGGCVLFRVSWPWALADERCPVSWSRNDSDDVALSRCAYDAALNRCALVTRPDILCSWRSFSTWAFLWSCDFSKGHLSYGAFSTLTDPLLVLVGSREMSNTA